MYEDKHKEVTIYQKPQQKEHRFCLNHLSKSISFSFKKTKSKEAETKNKLEEAKREN